MSWVSDEQISRAREIDLLSYMQAYEPFELRRDGPNRYVTETHGSLVIQAGKGAGYERWATVFNLKQAAQTLIYLQEHGLTEYDSLAKKTAAATARFNAVSDRMKVLETTLTANASLQKHIVQYSKTRDVYVQYRKAGYSKAFKETHEADILLHQAAKKHFDSLGMKKIPTIASLRAEYAVQLEDKKKAYREFQQARTEMRELLMVKANTDRLLNIPDSSKERKRDVPNK